jgi:cardiolipin hydrolase
MMPDEFRLRLAATFDDRRLSRGERQSLVEVFALVESQADREAIRGMAFDQARKAFELEADRSVIDWLEDVLKALRDQPGAAAKRTLAEAHFSPGDDCHNAIGRLLARASRTADICVFTITDDRLADAILEAHGRGVAVRIITDDQKAEDLGSDVPRFEGAGIPLRVDRSPFHMHHKFAILDSARLLTGSYNWTRGAARDNEENLIVTDDPRLVAPFSATFERLWAKLG